MRMARKFSCTCALGLFGLVAACSDPVAPAAQATASLYLTTAPAPARCPPGAHWVNVPFASAGGQQTSATSKGALAVDGQDQSTVSCTVKDNGGVFAVSASMRSPALNSNGMPANPTSISIATTIGVDQSAQGTVAIQDDKTATSFTSTNDMEQAGATCLFSVHPLMMGHQLAIAPGRMWASVTCPRFRDTRSSNLDEACQISPGYVVLENCAQ
jgi:hypothetical protein